MPMTGEDYRESLQDGRVIYYDGKRIDDVTIHPKTRSMVDIVASTYDSEDQERREGRFSLPRSVEELRLKMDDFIQWDDLLAASILGFLTLRTVSHRMADDMQIYRQRMADWNKHCKDDNIRLTICLTDAKGDRAVRPSRQADPDSYLRVVDQTPDGIVINGAKLHATGAAISHELLVFPTKRMSSEESQWAVACAVPVNSPGLTILNAVPGPHHEEFENHPFSRHHIYPEGFAVFDHVFVPNERVFLNGEVEHSATFPHSLGLWQRIGGSAKMAEEADMLVGLAHLLAEENGLGRIPHIKDKLAEMILHATMVRAALEAAISNAEFTDEGYATPSELYTNAAKYYGSTNLSRMLNHIHDIAGGSVLTVPLSGDLDNPEIAPYLEKYMSTKPEGNGAYRTKLMQSARDITASGYAGTWQVRVLLGGGGLYAQKLVASHHYDVNRAKALALEATGLGAFNGTS